MLKWREHGCLHYSNMRLYLSKVLDLLT